MRDLVTTWLDLAGIVLLTVALVTFIAQWTLPGALAAGGVFLLAASALIVSRTPKREGETVA